MLHLNKKSSGYLCMCNCLMNCITVYCVYVCCMIIVYGVFLYFYDLVVISIPYITFYMGVSHVV